LTALLSWHPERARWRQQFLMGNLAFALRSSLAERLLRTLPSADVLIQIGATFRVSELSAGLHVIYADANAAVGRSAAEFSEVGRLSHSAFDQMRSREQGVYAEVDAIWTFSGFLAQSFQHDFGIAAEKLTVIHGGANPHALQSDGSEVAWPRQPHILFVGKQHRRKGLDVLLRAFESVRERVPEAVLHVVGPAKSPDFPRGVHVHGPLRAYDPDDAALLRRLYRESAIFCMPSRFEPFGVVFAEAMAAGLPCIGTNRWAMPEIIVDGETGLTVPDGDAEALAAGLIRLLRDPAACEAMGSAGRARAKSVFSWDAVARRAVEDVERRLSAELVTQ
jgi:glycosyltransferase involved in cell wall biosynthesis